MLHDVAHLPNQSHLDQATGPLSDQILEFCESDLFQETNMQNSDVTCVSNCCYEEQSSYEKNLSFHPDMTKNPMPATTVATTFYNCNGGERSEGNFTTMFEEKIVENDISTSLDFTNLHQYSFSHQDDQFDLSLLQNHISLETGGHVTLYPHPNDQADVMPMMGPPMVCEPEFLSMPPSKCMHLNNPSSPNHCFLDHPYLLPSRNSNPILPIQSCGIFDGNLSLANEIRAHELDFQGDNDGVFCSDPLPRLYNSNELQVLSDESQHLVNNGGGSCCNPPFAPPELITSLESESFRAVSKLTSEERKEKIHRYMKKRNERNFSKKIKYACRKTLADSRPRVRGRFAKNDEFGEHHRNTCNTHEEDTDEDVKSMNAFL